MKDCKQLRMRLRRSARALIALVTVTASSACEPDRVLEPIRQSVAVAAAVPSPSAADVRAANAGLLAMRGNAAQQITWALQGRKLRGEQDEMLRIEAQVPGFGGFYIDDQERVVLMLKPSAGSSAAQIRNAVHTIYSQRASALERAVMATAPIATVVDADYSLSELIAFERTIADNLTSIGCFGAGVSPSINRVSLLCRDDATISTALTAVRSLGVPTEAVAPEAKGELHLTGTWQDRHRPTRGGIKIAVVNPAWGPNQMFVLSHGFNVRLDAAPGKPTRFLTASHINQYFTTNGVSGVTVYQSDVWDGPIGTITTNVPWKVTGDSGCDKDFCTDADGALGTFSGTSGERKIGTSQYEGLNGAPGTQQINNWYPINGYLDPSQVTTNPWGVHKSGFKTGTTTGSMLTPVMDIVLDTASWGPPGTGVKRSIRFWRVARVRSIGWGGGDSGGPVFARTQTCGAYCALGLQVAGSGTTWPPAGDEYDGICNAGTLCDIYYHPLLNIEQRLGLGTLNPRTVLPP